MQVNHEQRLASPRFDGIDTLRGLSILAVVLLHISLRMSFVGFSLQGLIPPWMFHLMFWNGNNGVTVFFAVSGFLITLTSLRRFGSLAHMPPGVFYRLRFARIAPLLLLLLALLSMLHLVQAEGFSISPETATLPQALFAALTFHLNWLEAVHGYLPANWDVLWSLSVEEMFYLFFPIVCALLLRWHRGMMPFLGLLLLFVVLGPLARTAPTANEIWREKSYLVGMDAIALGCASALLTERLLGRGSNCRTDQTARLRVVGMAGAALILLIALWPPWPWLRHLGRSGLDGTVLALGTCAVMVTTVLRGKRGGRGTVPIRWLGRHSYEVYLTHEFVMVWGTALYVELHWGPLPLWFIAILLLSAALGALVARYVTEPLNGKLRGGTTPPFKYKR